METISPYYVKPIHGTALKAIIEEGALMDQFMAMFKKKLDLDEKHLKNLVGLRASWNVKWREGKIGTLLAPILTHFEAEISHLTQANENLKGLWKEPPVAFILEPVEEHGFDPFEMPRNLENLFIQCKNSHDVVNTPAGKTRLRNWYKINHSEAIPLGWTFPQEDRVYRIYVVAQHRYVEKARKWYTNDMEAITERHQQHAEDIKKLLRASLCILNDQLSQSLTSCSSAVHSISSFASTQFIAARHEELEQEREHVLLQPFDYHSYYRSDKGEISRPVFDLGTDDMVAFVGLILDFTGLKWETWPQCMTLHENHSGVDHMLQLERRLPQKSSMIEALEEDFTKWPGYAILYIQLALWSGSPLLSISDQKVTQYESPTKRSFSFDLRRFPEVVLRRKMEPFTRLVESTIPAQVAQLVSRLLAGIMSTGYVHLPEDLFLCASSILTHGKYSASIIKEVWEKWDFIHDCPLSITRGPPQKLSPTYTERIKSSSSRDLSGSYNKWASSYIGDVVDWRYRIESVTRETGYYMEFGGIDMTTNNLVTVKMIHSRQPESTRPGPNSPYSIGMERARSNLQAECDALIKLFPISIVYYYMKHGMSQCFVIAQLGPDLEELLQTCGNKFTAKTAAMLGKRMITIIEVMHGKDLHFTDISPRNFVVGLREQKGNIYMNNIGLDNENNLFSGPRPLKMELYNKTRMFMSIHAHLVESLEISDDLESLGYMLIYFIRGNLPWEHLKLDHPYDLHESIASMKANMSLSQLCEGLATVYANRLMAYFSHIRNKRDPDYEYLRRLLQSLLDDIGELDDGIFDWDTIEIGEIEEQTVLPPSPPSPQESRPYIYLPTPPNSPPAGSVTGTFRPPRIAPTGPRHIS